MKATRKSELRSKSRAEQLLPMGKAGDVRFQQALNATFASGVFVGR